MNFSKPDRVYKFLSRSGTVRVSVLVARSLLSKLQGSHKPMSPLASVAMGRAMVSAALLSSHQKNGKIGLLFQGNGPLGDLYVESTYEGQIRGYVMHPSADLALANGKIDVSGGIGIGLLNVVSSLPHQKQPFHGTVIIKTGEIGDDIAFYLEQSHQIPSVVAVGEHINEYGLLTSSGGIIIELMPGHTEKEIEDIESNLKLAKSMSQMVLENYSPEAIVDQYLKGFDLLPIPHEHDLDYSCTCSLEKVVNSLVFMEEKDIQEMLEEQEAAHATCEFCGKDYSIPQEELVSVYQRIKKKGMH